MYDWSRFELRMPLAAALQTIYRSWATAAGLQTWLLREARFNSNEGKPRDPGEPVRPGDQFRWQWYGRAGELKGTILSANHIDELSFSFGEAGNVSVQILPYNEIFVCQLVQSGIPTDEQSINSYHTGCMKAWLFHLANLKSIIEGGIDLRDHDAALNKDENNPWADLSRFPAVPGNNGA
ncbi:MAG TPA: hypothetical protein VF145_09845 [Chitinophagaceae bacterium]